MKIAIAGGTGQVGEMLARAFSAKNHEVKILTRSAKSGPLFVHWDGHSLGDWKNEIDGADVVVNLAGRSVNCRYTKMNLEQMMQSRVESTKTIGAAIAEAKKPPQVWLQMSTATIYAHSFNQANDEKNGLIGGQEPDVPKYWGYSIEIAKAWEKILADSPTPQTRKVAMRSAMVMSPDRGGIFDVLFRLVRFGLGGPVGGGQQFVSWIHETDFVNAIEFLIHRSDITGVVNLSAPSPLPQAKFMEILRKAAKMPIGLPATKWMAEIGAFFLRTDTELLLKSRKVIPTRLLEAGFSFQYPDWESATRELVIRHERA